MKKSLLFGVLLLSILVIACTPNKQAQEPILPSSNDSNKEVIPIATEQCADYIRNGVSEKHCATCGNNICEAFESCTASSCTIDSCTMDCGPLNCEKDCPTEENKTPLVKPGTMPELSLSLRICRYDSDCISVQGDCCGCTAGGQAASINGEHQENWEKTIDVKCKDIACPAVMSNHWTCSAEAKCVNNKCTLVKAQQ
ncbi:MAG: hypothetical protein AABX65_02335 [Nanoarchaeota archaeon]